MIGNNEQSGKKTYNEKEILQFKNSNFNRFFCVLPMFRLDPVIFSHNHLVVFKEMALEILLITEIILLATTTFLVMAAPATTPL